MRISSRYRVSSRTEVDPRRACVRCQSPLTHHQPDVERPDRLLGICEECGAWYLIGSRGAVRIAFPGDDDAAE